jgi:hypothetical protein
MIRLKPYKINRYRSWILSEATGAQMTSTMVEYLQGIQIAKEATAPDKNGLGNLANNNKHFTRADDTIMRYTMCLDTLWRQYY